MNPIITAGDLQWLVESPRPPVIVDSRPLAEHEAAHIPGSVPVDVSDLVVDDTTMAGMYRVNEELDRRFRVVGNFEKRELLTYGRRSDPEACRALFFMTYAGHLAARVLDGGFEGWTAEGRPTTRETTPTDPTHFAVRGRREILARFDELAAATADGRSVLLDARSPEEFAGSRAAPDAPIPGTIPGARSLPWTLFLDPEGRRFADLESVRPRLSAMGLEPRTPLIVFSNAARRSSLVFAALRTLGYAKVRNLLGGYREWSVKARG